MSTYEDTAEELGLSITGRLGVNYDGDALQYVNIQSSTVAANKFTFPEEGLLQRWLFNNEQGLFVDSITNDANFRLSALSNTAFVPDNLTGGFAGLVQDLGTFSGYDAAEFSSITCHSGFYTPADSVFELFDNTPGATISIWLEANWPSLGAQGPAGLLTMVHEGQYDANFTADGRWRPYMDSSGINQKAVGVSFHHYQGMLYFILVYDDLLTYARLTTSLTGLSAGYHNIVGTFDSRFVRLYVDGVLKDEVDLGSYGNHVFYSNYNPRIAINYLPYNQDSYAYYRSGMAGKFRDIACWNRGMLPTEILGIYNEAMYSPGATESMNISEVVGYGDEYILPALLETFHMSPSTATLVDITAIATEVLDACSWLGSILNGSSTDQYHEPIYEHVGIPVLVAGLRTQLADILDMFSGIDVGEGLRSVIGNIEDSVNVNATIFSLEVLVAIELVRIEGTSDTAGSKFNRAISEGISVRSIIIASWLILIQESAFFEDSTSWKAEWFISLIEKVAASSDVLTRMEAAAAVAVAMAVADTGEAGKGGSVTDTMSLTVDTLSKATMFLNQIASVSLVTEGTGFLTIVCPVTEQTELAGEIDSVAILQDAISEGFAFQISFGTGETIYTGWAMNTESFGVSGYSSYPFNSFAKINNSYYGANANGLYLLEGSDDDGEAINASVMLGKTDFGTTMKTGVVEAYLGLRTDGAIILKIVTDDNKERWYRSDSGKQNLDNVRFKLARGVKSNYWQVGLRNVDGSDFELSKIEFVRVLMRRR